MNRYPLMCRACKQGVTPSHKLAGVWCSLAIILGWDLGVIRASDFVRGAIVGILFLSFYVGWL